MRRTLGLGAIAVLTAMLAACQQGPTGTPGPESHRSGTIEVADGRLLVAGSAAESALQPSGGGCGAGDTLVGLAPGRRLA